MSDQHDRANSAALAVCRELGLYPFGDEGTTIKAALLKVAEAARAEGYQAGVRDAEGMAEVHHAQRKLAWETAEDHGRRWNICEVETACMEVAADILHDIRTLKEGEK